MAKKTAKGSTSKVSSCDCKHPYQDAEYGEGQRVFNRKANGQFNCTVCGKTKV